MRLGIYGGTFDPVHYGHLLLAECCREQCRLDQVWFMPAASPPHKSAAQVAPAEHRAAMLELALGGHESLLVSRLELNRGGVSYTVDTLRALSAEDASRELFFLMGADSLHDLPNWREPGAICELATLVFVDRPGQPPIDVGALSAWTSAERVARFEQHRVTMPLIDLTSRDIRRRVADGQSIRFRTPRAVEAHVQAHGLYR